MLEPGTHLLGRPVAGSKPARSHPASSAKPYGTRRDADSLLAWILRAPEAVFGPGPYLPLRLLGEVAGSKPGLPPYSKEQCKTNFSPHLSLLGNTDSGRSLPAGFPGKISPTSPLQLAPLPADLRHRGRR